MRHIQIKLTRLDLCKQSAPSVAHATSLLLQFKQVNTLYIPDVQ